MEEGRAYFQTTEESLSKVKLYIAGKLTGTIFALRNWNRIEAREAGYMFSIFK